MYWICISACLACESDSVWVCACDVCACLECRTESSCMTEWMALVAIARWHAIPVWKLRSDNQCRFHWIYTLYRLEINLFTIFSVLMTMFGAFWWLALNWIHSKSSIYFANKLHHKIHWLALCFLNHVLCPGCVCIVDASVMRSA